MSWKYDTSNFMPVTKIERQACANKAHKHKGQRVVGQKLASSFHTYLLSIRVPTKRLLNIKQKNDKNKN